MNNLRKGFTLIELLVVIAVLGVLVTVVLVAIDPIQKLAQARDSGRESSTSQMGNATLAYATSNNSTYPTAAQWLANPNILVSSGELSALPGQVTNASYCGTNVVLGWCYASAALTGPAIIFSKLEAKNNIARCTAAFAGTTTAFAIYSSAIGRAGIVCTGGADPTVAGNSAGQNWLP